MWGGVGGSGDEGLVYCLAYGLRWVEAPYDAVFGWV